MILAGGGDYCRLSRMTLIVTTERSLADRNRIFRERLDTQKSSMKDECRKIGDTGLGSWSDGAISQELEELRNGVYPSLQRGSIPLPTT